MCSLQIAEPEGYVKKRAKPQCVDGAAMPSKRPRSSNTVEQDASRSKKRFPAITDFFNSIIADNSGQQENFRRGLGSEATTNQGHSVPTPDTAIASQSHDQTTTIGSSNMPAAKAEPRGGAALEGSSDEVVDGKLEMSRDTHGQPPLDGIRRIMADAAMRRWTAQQEAQGHQHVQLAECTRKNRVAPSPEQPVKPRACMDAGMCSARMKRGEGDEGCAHVSIVIDLVDDDEGNDLHKASLLEEPSSQGQREGLLSCPICGRTWSQQASEREVNDHIDACLIEV